MRCNRLSFGHCLPPKADMCSALANVRFVPKADIATPLSDVRFTPNSGHREGLDQLTRRGCAFYFWELMPARIPDEEVCWKSTFL